MNSNAVCRCCGRGTGLDVGEVEGIQDRGLEERMMGGWGGGGVCFGGNCKGRRGRCFEGTENL